MANLKNATVAAFAPDTSGGSLSGLKTVIGIVLIVAGHQLDVLNDVAMMLPDASWIDSVRMVLESVTDYGQSLLELLGSGFLSVGLLDKGIKFLRGIFG